MPVQLRRQLVVERGAFCQALTGPATRFVIGVNNGIPVIAAGTNPGAGVFYMEPDDYIDTKLRLRVIALTNATAPVQDLLVGVYPVTAVAGGVGLVNITPGAVIVPSQVNIVAPGASSIIQQVSSEFNWPAGGWYTIGIVFSATAAANSVTQLEMYLEAV